MPPSRRPGAGSHRGETGPPSDACGRWTCSPTLPGLQGLLSTSDPTSRGLHERDKHAGQPPLGESGRHGRRSLGRARGIFATEPHRNAGALGTRSASSRHTADRTRALLTLRPRRGEPARLNTSTGQPPGPGPGAWGKRRGPADGLPYPPPKGPARCGAIPHFASDLAEAEGPYRLAPSSRRPRSSRVWRRSPGRARRALSASGRWRPSALGPPLCLAVTGGLWTRSIVIDG